MTDDPNAALVSILVLGLVGIGVVAVFGLIWIVVATFRDRLRARRRAADARREMDEQAAYRSTRTGIGSGPTWKGDFDENAPVGTVGADDEPPDGEPST
jgi:hypothetical protein